MSQNDMNVGNAQFGALRTDLNNALAALVSLSSGATEPATMYAYQWWADTTTGLLKIRNAANTAWITVGTLGSANLGLASLAGADFTGTVSAAPSGITDAVKLSQLSNATTYGLLQFGSGTTDATCLGMYALQADGNLYSNVPAGGSHVYRINGSQVSKLSTVGFALGKPDSVCRLDVTDSVTSRLANFDSTGANGVGIALSNSGTDFGCFGSDKFVAGGTLGDFGIYATANLKLYGGGQTTNKLTLHLNGAAVTGQLSSTGLSGYAAGGGGTVAQSTSKSTGVTLNKPSGQITMNNAALAGGAEVIFALTNSLLSPASMLKIHHQSGGSASCYRVMVDSVVAGGANIRVKNESGGSLSEALVLNFEVNFISTT